MNAFSDRRSSDQDAAPTPSLPPGQQWAAAEKWPVVGERASLERCGPWTVGIAGRVRRPQCLTLTQLRELGWHQQRLDVHCVTRWSKPQMLFGGVPLARVLALAEPLATARFVSFIAASARRHDTSLPLSDALASETLIADEFAGRPLEPQHGGPLRVVVPGRYFYKSLKWLVRIDCLAEDRLGFWERTAGYHNEADPWRSQRYAEVNDPPAEVEAWLVGRDVTGRSIRGLAAAERMLEGLRAQSAILRDADFRRAQLRGADFSRANLSNAHFGDADLQRARFVEADVEGADFTGADLRNADFRGASLLGVTFCSSAEGQASRVARIDKSTRFDTSSLNSLSATEEAFVRAACACGGGSSAS